MIEDEDLVSGLAVAILDDAAIDWTAAAESAADRGVCEMVAELRVVAGIAKLHRSLPPPSAATHPPAKREGPLTEWGHLRVLECIGWGAFGVVYRAWDPTLDREVALKLMPAPHQRRADQPPSIIEEGRLLARVRHPNVATIYGAEQIGDEVGLWMEFVRGRTLAQIVRDGLLFNESESVEIGIALCHAIGAVHRAGLLHRDIKAQNVVRSDDGRTVLMDFGAGRDMATTAASDLAGTPLYLAPEILEGQAATVQSDVYSLGVLLYYVTVGSYPVTAERIADLRAAHESNRRAGIRHAAAATSLSRKLTKIIERATDPLPERRYPTMEAFAADLSRVQRRWSYLPLGYAVAAVLLILALAFTMRRLGTAPEPDDARAADPATPPVIAVLPFDNLGGGSESDEFVEGLTVEIIRNLAVIDGLQVRSRTSSFAFKDTPRRLAEVGERLGASLLLEGSVLRSGNNLRVQVRLVRAADDRALWAAKFDRQLADLFIIQDEISRAIVNELRLTLGRGQRRYDTNVEAYELYLRGRALVERGGVPNLERAVDLFQQVLSKDAAFAPAYAGLANAYALMSAPVSSALPFAEPQARLRQAAFRARDLDPLLADAHAAIGWTYAREQTWPAAEQAFRRALELNPSLTQTFTSFTMSTLQPLLRFDEAQQMLQTALANDPLSLEILQEIGIVHLLAGRYAEAAETLRHVLAVDAGFPFTSVYLGRALLFGGKVEDALPVLETLDGRHLGRQKPAGATRSPWLARAYVESGRRQDAEALIPTFTDSPVALAIIHAALGNRDGAFDALQHVAAVQRHHVGRILNAPELAPLEGDPRLAALRERFALPAPRQERPDPIQR